MSIVELLFVVSLFLPPAVVVIGALVLAMPGRRAVSQASPEHAHAH
jgi:hypothetical protein